jgi:hypothetical protein
LVCDAFGLFNQVSAGGDEASARFISTLRRLESASGRYVPGTLLLAQSPVDLTRWAPKITRRAANVLALGLLAGAQLLRRTHS